MKPFEAYAAYTAAILGQPVEDAEAKFNALVRVERDAWEAVAAAAVPVKVGAPVPQPALPKV